MPQLIVAFGTGQRTQFTLTRPRASDQTGTQSLYGVWDWNITAWNTKSTAASYASLTGAQVGGATGTSSPYTLGPSNLQKQTFTPVSGGVDTSNTTITWEQCTPGCNAGKFGWYANLPATLGATNGAGAAITEQIVSSPSFYQGAFIVNSTIPASALPLSCATPRRPRRAVRAVGRVRDHLRRLRIEQQQSDFRQRVRELSRLAARGPLDQRDRCGNGRQYGRGHDLGHRSGHRAAGCRHRGAWPDQQINLPLNTSTNRVTWIELR